MKLWFRAKTYGYGWTPCSWQGWLVVSLYCVLTIVTFFVAEALLQSERNSLLLSVFLTLLYTCMLIWISAKKGEKAKWRWGRDKL
jgi:inner membrane protein involved in colicin E2 resistance